MDILALEIEAVFGLFVIVVSGTLGLIIQRLFQIYTKKEVDDLINRIKGNKD